MRPVEYTSDEIIKAGRELQAAGRNITGFALRAKVGGGNPSRLKQVWDEHLSSTAAESAEPVAELPVEVADELAGVSKDLTERLAVLAAGLNDKAVKAAERRVAEVVRTAGEQREQAERELADATQTVDDLEDRLDEASGRIVSLEAEQAEAAAAHQAQAVELAQVRERLVASERLVDELRTKLEKADAHGYGLTDRVNELQGSLYEATANATREGELRQRAESELKTANDRLATLQGNHEAQAVELAQVCERLAEAERQERAAAVRHETALVELRDSLAAAAKSSVVQGNELAQVRERLAASDQQAADLSSQLAAATAAATEQGAELVSLRQSVQQLTGELGRATGECEALRRQAGEQTKAIAAFASRSPAGDKRAKKVDDGREPK